MYKNTNLSCGGYKNLVIKKTEVRTLVNLTGEHLFTRKIKNNNIISETTCVKSLLKAIDDCTQMHLPSVRGWWWPPTV